jgi:predicted GIY-YIG superfamily endonuclease
VRPEEAHDTERRAMSSVEGCHDGWCIYALRCRNNYLYIGSTNNLARRLEEHRTGGGSKFVRAQLPFELVRVIPCENSHMARSMEYRLKRLRRDKKLAALALDQV